MLMMPAMLNYVQIVPYIFYFNCLINRLNLNTDVSNFSLQYSDFRKD